MMERVFEGNNDSEFFDPSDRAILEWMSFCLMSLLIKKSILIQAWLECPYHIAK